MSDKVITADLLARLQRHYIKPGEIMPGGMFMPEVSLGTRRADALYVGFFASRGKFLVGHELKVSRADWLHELADPSKAETWYRECHSWYLVVPHASIVHDGELPPGWGLMVPGKSVTRMNILVKAEHRPDVQPSWEATHAIVQRADSLRMAAIAEATKKAQDAIHEEVTRLMEQAKTYSDEARLTQRAERAEALVEAVSEAIGLRVVPGDGALNSRMVTVDELRGSFSRWLAADAATRENLPFQRGAAARTRQAAEELEAALEALVSGPSA